MYDNGYIAMSDIHAGWMNLVNALEKIPGTIAQYKELTAKLKVDVPQNLVISHQTIKIKERLGNFIYSNHTKLYFGCYAQS